MISGQERGVPKSCCSCIVLKPTYDLPMSRQDRLSYQIQARDASGKSRISTRLVFFILLRLLIATRHRITPKLGPQVFLSLVQDSSSPRGSASPQAFDFLGQSRYFYNSIVKSSAAWPGPTSIRSNGNAIAAREAKQEIFALFAHAVRPSRPSREKRAKRDGIDVSVASATLYAKGPKI